MADFPTILPTQINYDLGGLNVSDEATTTGGPIRFRHSLRQSQHQITLVYTNLLESEATQIRDHFLDSNGFHQNFKLPTEIWGDADVLPAESLFRYREKPIETQRGVYTDISVELLNLVGVRLVYVLAGEPAELGAEESVNTFAFIGTAPFIMDSDDADPETAATSILQGGGAAS